MNKFYNLIVLILSCSTSLLGQIPVVDFYAMGMEAGAQGNFRDAVEYLSKETNLHPNNGQAFYSLSLVQSLQNDYKGARSSINKAVDIFSFAEDKENLGLSYSLRANLCLLAGDTITALNDFEKAIDVNPKDVYDMGYYAYLLAELNQFEKSDSLFNRMITIDHTYPFGYLGLGENALTHGQVNDAFSHANKVIGMSADNAWAFTLRSKVYKSLGAYPEAAEDIMKALSYDTKNDCKIQLYDFPKDQYALLISKLDEMSKSNPEDAKWLLHQSQLYMLNDNYEEAITTSWKGLDLEDNDLFRDVMLVCFPKLDNSDKVLKLGFRRLCDNLTDNTIGQIGSSKMLMGLIEDYKANAQNGSECIEDEVGLLEEEHIISYVIKDGLPYVECSILSKPSYFSIMEDDIAGVKISKKEVQSMQNAGFLKKEDLIVENGKKSDEIYDGMIVNLPVVSFFGFKLINVKATVVDKQNIPLLLSRPLLSSFGEIETDNDTQKLIITCR